MEQGVVSDWGTVNEAGFIIKKRAKFTFCGDILSRAFYNDQPQSVVSPGDVVISWGGGAGDGVEVFQKNRWYFFRKSKALRRDAFLTTANIHLVGQAAERLLLLSPGEAIRASGWLVDVYGPSGFVWKTSTTRHDRGEGACEIFFVENFSVLGGEDGLGW